MEATFSIPVTPRPTNTSLIFPRASTGIPASWSRSRYVGPGGSNEKSRRSFVLAKAPGLPVNGRAMTRATPCGPCRIPRAISHHSYSDSRGTTSTWAAIWKTLSAEVYTIGHPVAMCSAPNSSMITVPDAVLLPSTPLPMRSRNGASTSSGNPSG